MESPGECIMRFTHARQEMKYLLLPSALTLLAINTNKNEIQIKIFPFFPSAGVCLESAFAKADSKWNLNNLKMSI
jgi:hypothetical protein